MRKLFKFILRFSIALVISFCIFYSINYLLNNGKSKQKENAKTTPKTEEKQEIWPKTYEASIIATGDGLVHSSVYKDAFVADDKYDFTKQIKDIKPIINKYDLAYYNGETIIGGKNLGLSAYPRFNTPDEYGDAMIDCGFNLVSLSSNHTMDKGESGVLYSLNYWKNKTDVMTSGSYLSEQERITPRIKEKNGIKYTMLSYTMLDNGLKTPTGKEFYSVMYSDELAKEDIKRVNDKVDVIIVSIHWGDEYSITPTDRQKEIAKYLSGLGVDIIYGTHPHVLQPVEIIGNTVVYYSLGNFISAQEGVTKLTGVLSSLNIKKYVQKDGTSNIKLENLENELIYTYYSNWRNFKVIPYKDLNDSLLPNYKSYYSTYSNILKSIDTSISVSSLE